jgi:WD40 repeat protein
MSSRPISIPSSRGRPAQQFKPLYVVTTDRFAERLRPHSCIFDCPASSSVVVAVAVNTKLNIAVFQTVRRAPPTAHKYSFESPIVSLAGCESQHDFSIFVVLKENSYLIHADGTTILVKHLPILTVSLQNAADSFHLLGGTDNGLLAKVCLDNQTEAPFCKTVSTSGISQIEISNSRTLIACGFLNGSVALFRDDSFESVWSSDFDSGSIRALAWNRDSDILAFAGQDDNFYTIDVSKDFAVLSFCGHSSFVNSLSFDPGWKSEIRLFSAAEDGMLGCWDAKEGKAVKAAMVGPFDQAMRQVVCLKKVLVSVDAAGGVVCWRRTSG